LTFSQTQHHTVYATVQLRRTQLLYTHTWLFTRYLATQIIIVNSGTNENKLIVTMHALGHLVVDALFTSNTNTLYQYIRMYKFHNWDICYPSHSLWSAYSF